MIPLTLAEIAEVTGGALTGDADPAALVSGGVEFDSRRIGPGGLFLALAGEHADGHDFVDAARAAGAAAALVSRPVPAPAIVVPDVLAALSRLAHAVVRRLPDLTVVGITGSSGKTSTKDLVADLLRRRGPTVAPPGSFNNELGHPYTILLAKPESRYLVLENSARGIGHIAALCAVARPDISVVLNVGTAHVGEFGSKEAIAQAKGELVECLAPEGVAVLNADDPLVCAMAGRTRARVVRTGQAATADVRAEGVRLDGRGRPSYLLVARGERHPVTLGLVGAHHVGNSLAAAAVALELGMAPADVATALGDARPASRWRMEVVERPDGVTIVNDAYNANPESMRAALETLAALAAGRRSWAVLGEMAELGPRSAGEHDAVGRLAARLGVDRLVVVGERAAAIHDGAVQEGAHGRAGRESVQVPDIAAAVRVLRNDLRAGDVVLVKASRAVGLERVVDLLMEENP